MDEQNELVSVAMQIILNAGNARNSATDALAAAKTFDFVLAEQNLKEAEESITKAHKAQTEIIQSEAGGHSYAYSLLFTHAQDTLMTINSEVRLTKEMIDVLKIIHNKTEAN